MKIFLFVRRNKIYIVLLNARVVNITYKKYNVIFENL